MDIEKIFNGVTFHYTDEAVAFSQGKNSPAFIKHFDITFYTNPLNLADEFAIHMQNSEKGIVRIAAQFPGGVLNILKEKHPNGIVEMRSHMFAQFVLIVHAHLKRHSKLSLLTYIQLNYYANEEHPTEGMVCRDGYYYANLDGIFMGLTPDGIKTIL